MIVRRPLDANQLWFPEARYGMFVHFGLYALLGRGEWVMYHDDLRREDYARLARRFNPRRFDGDEWVQTARDCGCRYLTVTAKHHDGFCLFDSALTDYKITNTPFQRDLIGELIAACQRGGMPIILYYSQPDWHHPSFVHRPQAFKDLQYTRPEDQPDWAAYLRYYHGQVEELCTRYGKIDGIWFDGVQRTEQEWEGRRLYELIRHHQPHAVVNDRAGYGDFFTPERSLSHLAAAAGYAVEACQSVAEHAWGYRTETPLYSSAFLLHSLLRMAAAGGNYLLNLGPRPDGSLPPTWVERMRPLGQWLNTHGAAVYGTAGCPLQAESDERLYTRRGQTLYLHLLRWPETDRLALKRLRVAPRSARVLGTGQKLAVGWQEGQAVLSGLPGWPPDGAANVIELRFAEDEMFRRLPRKGQTEVVDATADGTLFLPVEMAHRTGFGFKGSVLSLQEVRAAEVEVRRPAEMALGANWTPEQAVHWRLQAPAGRYQVAVTVRCAAPFHGSGFEVRVGRQRLVGEVPDTGDTYAEVALGEVELCGDETTATLRPTRPHYAFHFAQVKGLVLRPV